MIKVSTNEDNDPKRPARIVKLFRNIANTHASIQKQCSEKAQEFGYSKDVFSCVAKKFEKVPDDPMLDGVEAILKQQFLLAQAQEKDYAVLLQADVVGMTCGTAAATTSTLLVFDSGVSNPIVSHDLWDLDRKKKYIVKFDKLDVELGRIFRSVWETFYSTTSSPEKNALYAMRQSFDHFFRILAPDEEVRRSKFFILKVGEKDENKVHRLERIQYAANTKIGDKKVAGLLAAEADHILKVYDKLNMLHSAKKLDREAVQELLTSMQRILEQWVDAVGI